MCVWYVKDLSVILFGITRIFAEFVNVSICHFDFMYFEQIDCYSTVLFMFVECSYSKEKDLCLRNDKY